VSVANLIWLDLPTHPPFHLSYYVMLYALTIEEI